MDCSRSARDTSLFEYGSRNSRTRPSRDNISSYLRTGKLQRPPTVTKAAVTDHDDQLRVRGQLLQGSRGGMHTTMSEAQLPEPANRNKKYGYNRLHVRFTPMAGQEGFMLRRTMQFFSTSCDQLLLCIALSTLLITVTLTLPRDRTPTRLLLVYTTTRTR